MKSALLYRINRSANMFISEFETKAKLQLQRYKAKKAGDKKGTT